MEAHLVHYESQFENVDDAIKANGTHGVAVIAFLFENSTRHPNSEFQEIAVHLPKIESNGKSITIDAHGNLHIYWMFLVINKSWFTFLWITGTLAWMKSAASSTGYYSYCGSLTTGPFNELVRWIVYPKPIKLSNEQVGYRLEFYVIPIILHSPLESSSKFAPVEPLSNFRLRNENCGGAVDILR